MAKTKSTRATYTDADRQVIADAVAQFPGNVKKGIHKAATNLKRSTGAINSYYYSKMANASSASSGLFIKEPPTKLPNGAHHNGASHNGAISRMEFAKIIVDVMQADEKKELLRYLIA